MPVSQFFDVLEPGEPLVATPFHRFVVGLQVQDVVGDKAKHQILVIHAITAKHASNANRTEVLEDLLDIFNILAHWATRADKPPTGKIDPRPASTCRLRHRPLRIPITQQVQREAGSKHRPRREKQPPLRRIQVHRKRRQCRHRMKKEYGAVSKSLGYSEQESGDDNEFHGADYVHHRSAQARHEIKVSKYRRGVIRSEKLVQRPDQHYEKNAQAQCEQCNR